MLSHYRELFHVWTAWPNINKILLLIFIVHNLSVYTLADQWYQISSFISFVLLVFFLKHIDFKENEHCATLEYYIYKGLPWCLNNWQSCIIVHTFFSFYFLTWSVTMPTTCIYNIYHIIQNVWLCWINHQSQSVTQLPVIYHHGNILIALWRNSYAREIRFTIELQFCQKLHRDQ